MNVREMLTKWGFKIEHEKLTRVEQQLEGIKRRLEFLAAVEVAKGLFNLVERFSKVGEELHSVSQAVGIGVEDFQRLAFSASQASVSQEELSGSMRRLARQIYSAREGSEEANRAFQALGISPERVKGFKNAEAALLAVSDQMRSIDDPIKKAALAQQLLGRSSTHMVGYLSQGSAALRAQGIEANKLGIILSEKQVHALVKVENALTKFWAVLKSIASIIAAEVAPVLEYLINDFIKFFGANRDFIQGNMIEFLGKLAFAFGFVWEALKFGITLVKDLAKQFHMDNQLLSFIGLIGGVVGSLLAARKAFQLLFYIIDTVKLTFGLLASPIVVFLALAALIFVALHDIWEGIHGRPTWINTFMEWLGIADAVNGAFETAFEWLFKIWEIGTKVTATLGQGILGAVTLGNSSALTPEMTRGITSAGAPGGGAPSYAVSAPMNISVPAGTNPADVGSAVGDAVREHLDYVHRQTMIGSSGAVAY